MRHWKYPPGRRCGGPQKSGDAGDQMAAVFHALQDGLPFALAVVQPRRLRVIGYQDRPVVDANQLLAIEGVAADHALTRLLRPHLVEDEVAVRIGDELALVDL